MTKELLFSVTVQDCRVDFFTVGGNGGGGKDTSSTGVRVVHVASGAVGRAVDTRSQLKNKQLAFRRMAESQGFKSWAKVEASRLTGRPSVEQQVEEAMEPRNLKVEMMSDTGAWVPYVDK